jgi:high frequency lysogenization protein
LTGDEVVACLAETYSETVSTLSPRIMVTGEPNLLNRPEIANRIRALLLAGVRAAVLTVEQARQLLAEIGRRKG